MFDFNGKVILVTGATSSIGRDRAKAERSSTAYVTGQTIVVDGGLTIPTVQSAEF